jgi:hypothetical protein
LQHIFGLDAHLLAFLTGVELIYGRQTCLVDATLAPMEQHDVCCVCVTVGLQERVLKSYMGVDPEHGFVVVLDDPNVYTG